MEFGELFLLHFAPSTENGLPLIWARPRFCEDNISRPSRKDIEIIGWIKRDNITNLPVFELCDVEIWK